MKCREKTGQVRGNWSQQLEHKQDPKRGDGTKCPEGRASPYSMPHPLQTPYGNPELEIKVTTESNTSASYYNLQASACFGHFGSSLSNF